MKKFTLLLLSFILAFGFAAGGCNVNLKAQVKAEENEVLLGEAQGRPKGETAGELAVAAFNALFGDYSGNVTIGSILRNSFNYYSNAMTFLKLIGVVKDPTEEAFKNIQYQLTMINDKINVMDAKLDDIIKAMAELKAETEFISRTDRARDYRQYFKNFNDDHCTNSLDKLTTEFEAMRINALKDWYNAAASDERKGTIDNSRIILIFDKDENDDHILRYTTDNGVPTDFDGRYVVLESDFLPVSEELPSWHIDNYREALENKIADKIKTNFDALDFNDYGALTAENDEAIAAVAADAVNVIIYRVTAKEVNKDAHFALNVLDAFDNYKNALLADENGFDAIVRSLYYSHAFEYQISDIIKEIYYEYTVKTTYYGAFVQDVVAMSSDVSKDRRDKFDDGYFGSIIDLESKKDSALTGEPTYCYLTNTLITYGTVSFETGATVWTYKDGPNYGYTSYEARSFSYTVYNKPDGKTTRYYDRTQLIGNASATLLSMTLSANGVNAAHSYFNTNLIGNSQSDYGAIAVSFDTESNLSQDSPPALRNDRVIGVYFTAPAYSLNALPSGTEKEYIRHNKNIRGSLFDFTTGTLKVNTPLAAFAVFAEDHWYWSNDEVSLLGGPYDAKFYSTSLNTVCTKNYGKNKFEHYYNLKLWYNCLIRVPLKQNLMAAPGILDSFKAETQKLMDEEHLDELNQEADGEIEEVTYTHRSTEPDKEKPSTNGCGAGICLGAGILAIVTAVGAAVVARKKEN